MKHADSASQPVQEPAWQLLGEKILPTGADLQDIFFIWLAALLHPLHLHEAFLNKLLDSAKESIHRAVQVDTVEQSGHLHMLVYARSRISPSHTWGFFRIERIEDPHPGQDTPRHVINFYLYPEGL